MWPYCGTPNYCIHLILTVGTHCKSVHMITNQKSWRLSFGVFELDHKCKSYKRSKWKTSLSLTSTRFWKLIWTSHHYKWMFCNCGTWWNNFVNVHVIQYIETLFKISMNMQRMFEVWVITKVLPIVFIIEPQRVGSWHILVQLSHCGMCLSSVNF